MRGNTYRSYFLNSLLDFEVLLDAAGKLVPVRLADEKTQESYQK